MKVVVTGGSGFIGSWLCELLCADGAVTEIVNFDLREPGYPPKSDKYRFCLGDTRSPGDLAGVFEGAEEVYDFAAVLGTAELFASIEEAVQTNVLGGLHVLEAARQAGVDRVCWPSKVNAWSNVYSATKVGMERIVDVYRDHFGLSICVVCPWNLYGPRQKLIPVRKYFPTFAAQALTHAPITVYGSGYQFCNVHHVEDAAAEAIAACRSGSVGYGEPVHLAGHSMTVNQVAEDIHRWAKSHSTLCHVEMRAGEEKDSQLIPDPARPTAAMLLGLPPRDWKNGGRATLNWYRCLGADKLRNAVQFHQGGG